MGGKDDMVRRLGRGRGGGVGSGWAGFGGCTWEESKTRERCLGARGRWDLLRLDDLEIEAFFGGIYTVSHRRENDGKGKGRSLGGGWTDEK